jgi:hypothetical protein
MQAVRRIVLTVVIAAVILTAGATPAFAHSVSGVGATNFKTTLTKQPKIAGLHVKVIEAGSRLEATYSGAGTLFVLGYTDEQYLRIDRRGVFENLKSPATYINKTRNGVNPPGDADARAKPEWHKVSSGRVARWHDHRVHWMGGINPPLVTREPGKRHVIVPDWKVNFVHGATRSAVEGSLTWVPGPSPVVPMVLILLCIGGLVVLARRFSPFLVVAIATAVMVAVDVVHSFAIGFANAGTTAQQLGRTFSSSSVSIPAWIVGGGAVYFLLRRRVDGFFAAVFTGLLVAVVGGFADASVLTHSEVPFALSPGAARVIVALSLGLGIGVAAASGLAIRRLEPSKPTEAEQ